jgi:hypothetical protein
MSVKKAKTKAGKTTRSAYACKVCGAVAVINPVCGCAEEHVVICCGTPMKKAVAKKSASKKGVKK